PICRTDNGLEGGRSGTAHDDESIEAADVAGDVAGGEPDGNAVAQNVSRAHRRSKRREECGLEQPVGAKGGRRVDRQPDGIDPVGVVGAQRARQGVGGGHRILVNEDGEPRRAGSLAVRLACRRRGPCHHEQGQRPSKRAGRFSRNAVVPSFMSCVAASRPKWFASSSSPSSSLISTPWSTASRQRRMASGAIASIPRSIFSDSASSSAAGTTLLTRPMRYASWASINSPERISCNATPLPTSRGSRCVPPYPGAIPSLTSGCPNFAVSLASRRWQAIASSHPPPSAE